MILCSHVNLTKVWRGFGCGLEGWSYKRDMCLELTEMVLYTEACRQMLMAGWKHLPLNGSDGFGRA